MAPPTDEAPLLGGIDGRAPVRHFWKKTGLYLVALLLAACVGALLVSASGPGGDKPDNGPVWVNDAAHYANTALGTCNEESGRLAPSVFLIGADACGNTTGMYDDLIAAVPALLPMHGADGKAQRAPRYFDTRGMFVSEDLYRELKPVPFGEWLRAHADTCEAVAGKLTAV